MAMGWISEHPAFQPTKQLAFNVAPLYIGYDNLYNGTNGQISYFNWRLSADEVAIFSNDSSITSVKSTTPTNNIPIMADIVNRDYRPEVTEESPGHEVTLNKI
ncbi:unnamed protein product [Rhizophagus irregularis]|nr:unnamed protein product [Rhizophagus irregularis]